VDTQNPSLPDAPQLNDDNETEDFASMLRENDLARAGAVDRSGGSKQIDATVVAITADMVFLVPLPQRKRQLRSATSSASP
jgi:small subunit ribosomal protein S1